MVKSYDEFEIVHEAEHFTNLLRTHVPTFGGLFMQMNFGFAKFV